MASRTDIVNAAIKLFEDAEYPSGFTLDTAWLGFYQTLLWYEPVNLLLHTQVPHLIEANALNPRAAKQGKLRKWQARAVALNDYLAEHLNCSPSEVQFKVDKLLRSDMFKGMQRQNYLGTAFSGLLTHAMGRFGNPELTYENEVLASEVYAGLQLPGRSEAAKIDVLVRGPDGRPVAIVSAKWSVRHDRLSDVTNECPIYKNAHNLQYRHRSDAPLKFYVATNEFNPARLVKMLSERCVDGVVHVHKRAVTDVCGLNGRMNGLLDLEDLVKATLGFSSKIVGGQS
jgi:hypothetical protein